MPPSTSAQTAPRAAPPCALVAAALATVKSPSPFWDVHQQRSIPVCRRISPLSLSSLTAFAHSRPPMFLLPPLPSSSATPRQAVRCARTLVPCPTRPAFLPRPLFPTPAPANPIDANVCAISHSRSPPGLPHLQTPSIPSPSWEFPTMISQMSSSPTRCLHDCRCLSAVRFQSSRQNPGYSQQQRLSVCIIHRPPPRPYTKDPTDHLSGPHLLLASVLNMTSPFLTYHPPDNSPQTAPLSRPSPDCPRSNPDACLANPSPVSNTATCPPSSPWPSPSLLAHFTLW